MADRALYSSIQTLQFLLVKFQGTERFDLRTKVMTLGPELAIYRRLHVGYETSQGACLRASPTVWW